MPHRHSNTSATALLARWRAGDIAALDALMPIVYAELRRLARAHLRRERQGHSLHTTALVHEAYLRLVDIEHSPIESRAHFFALAARVMRRILVDHARRRQAAKRGGQVTMVALEDVSVPVSTNIVDVIALDRALDQLARVEERLSLVVELKCFAGLNINEMAVALDVSPATVERDWTIAKAWLYAQLDSPSPRVRR